MIKLLGALACCLLCILSNSPLLAQSSPSKPKSPGEIAAADRVAMAKRAACQREAREKKLRYLQRNRFVRNCVKS